MKLLYFAWIRDDIGLDGEEISLPDGVKTVGDLIALLKGRGDSYERGLMASEELKVAVNLEYANLDTPISDSDEVAFFPPVTGGKND